MNTITRGGYQNPGLLVLGTLLCVPFALLAMGQITMPFFVAGLIMILYLTLLVVNFELGFLTLIFIRSSLDYVKHSSEGGSANVAAAVSAVIIVLGIFYVLYKKTDIFQFEDTKPFLVFLAVQGLSIFHSPSLMSSVSDWLRLLSVFSVYILTRMVFVSESKIKAGMTSILLSSLIPVLFGIFQLVTGKGRVMDGGMARIVGTFIHPNAFGSYLLIMLVFCMAQILEGSRFVNRNMLKFLVGITSMVFLMTFSRGAWIVFVVAMIFMGAMRYRRLLVLVPILMVVAVAAVPGVRARILDVVDRDGMRGRSAWQWRLDTWSQVGDMIKTEPYIGHGLSTVELEIGVLTHNDYLRLLAETGILGLFSYFFLAGTALRKTWKDYRNSTNDTAKSFQLGLLAIILGFLVRELADNTLRNTVVMIYLWAFVALVRNLGRLYSNPERIPRENRYVKQSIGR